MDHDSVINAIAGLRLIRSNNVIVSVSCYICCVDVININIVKHQDFVLYLVYVVPRISSINVIFFINDL